jgi:hypothetical protein
LVVFLPSFAYLSALQARWTASGALDALRARKQASRAPSCLPTCLPAYTRACLPACLPQIRPGQKKNVA